MSQDIKNKTLKCLLNSPSAAATHWAESWLDLEKAGGSYLALEAPCSRAQLPWTQCPH